MKLDYVEVCGFRGFRDRARIDFGSGFTVITGRNGVGKSTLCDAIEFAIVGELAKYAVASSANETVRDYIWWRGEGRPADHYVKVGFIDAEGKHFAVTRTREGVDRSPAEIEAVLCQGAVPDDPLRQLCKTSVIRDEWIAALSLDLSETQRFDLVRAALGSIEGSDLSAKAKAVVAVADAFCDRTTTQYQEARAGLSGGLVQLSEATDAANRSADVSTAIALIDRLVPSTDGDIAARFDIAQRSLPNRRRQVEALNEAAFGARELILQHRAFNSPAEVSRRDRVRADLSAAELELERAQGGVDAAQHAYDIEATANEIAASLAVLLEHGEALGLHEAHCPLCAAARTQDEFNDGLAAARARIKNLAGGVGPAHAALVAARQLAAEAELKASVARERLGAIERDEQVLRAKEKAHRDIFERHGLDLAHADDPEALEQEAFAQREQLLELERALNALEASRAVGVLSSVEARVAMLRTQADAAADALTRAQAAVAAAKSLEKSVRRSSSEIVDERLARISPLLNEIYQRLRPHANWRSIEYSIRGDVRRFLSLKVGDGLNPQFVFSSGQRRAAGLAFLLSVHLARPWARWQTLVLDDPVQHIDDYRALQLVEVLASLRQSGRQVVVAVEDAALADLLCRRLPSTLEQGGRRVSVDFSAEGAADVIATQDIPPMAAGVLRSFEDALAVA